MTIKLTTCYRVSPDVVAREIEGELVIVPLKSGLGDLDAEMYALSTTGIAVWNKLDGDTPLDDVIKALSAEYGAAYEEVRMDVVELMEELLRKGLAIGP
ncbi:MAG: PqqD family protein [Pseudomonadota bacterium]